MKRLIGGVLVIASVGIMTVVEYKKKEQKDNERELLMIKKDLELTLHMLNKIEELDTLIEENKPSVDRILH